MKGELVMQAPPPRGPGQPRVGGAIPGMNLGDELLKRVMRWAALNETNRSDAIRTLLTRQLDAEERRSAGRSFEAVAEDGERYQFRSLSKLALRLGGTTYEVRPEDVDAPDAADTRTRYRFVAIKRGGRRLFDVRVPLDAVALDERPEVDA